MSRKNHKKAVLIWLILWTIGFTFTGCRSARQIIIPTLDQLLYTTYVNPDEQFLIQYPFNWEIIIFENNQVQIDPPKGNTLVEISLMDIDDFGDPITILESFAEDMLENESVEITQSPELISLNEYQAARMYTTETLYASINKGLFETSTSKPDSEFYEIIYELEWTAISDGKQGVVIVTKWPNGYTNDIIQSFTFIP